MRRLLVGMIVGVLLAVLAPAVARTIPGERDVPRVAIVARGDNPVDALSAGPIAAALGGILVLSTPDELSGSARDALVAFAPDLVILAGGEGALSEAVFDAVDDAGDWGTDRVSGPTRYDTAAEFAALLEVFDLDGVDVSDAVPADDATTYVQANGTPDENGAALLLAIGNIPDFDEVFPGDHVWTVRLAPGTYDLAGDGIILPDGVHLVGDGPDRTTITTAREGPVVGTDVANVVERLRILNDFATTGDVYGIFAGLDFPGGSVTLRDVVVEVGNVEGNATGIAIAGDNLTGRLTDVKVLARANGGAVGIDLASSRGMSLVDGDVHASGDAVASAALRIGSAAVTATTVRGTRLDGDDAPALRHLGEAATVTVLQSELIGTPAGSVVSGTLRIGASLVEGGLASVGVLECIDAFDAEMNDVC